MLIFLLEDNKLSLPMEDEVHAIHGALMFSKVFGMGQLSESIFMYQNLPAFGESNIVSLAVDRAREVSEKIARDIERQHKLYCKLKTAKHKSKEDLIYIEQCRAFNKAFLDSELEAYKEDMAPCNGFELLKFFKDEQLNVFIDMDEPAYDLPETLLQQVIIEIFKEHDEMLMIHDAYTKQCRMELMTSISMERESSKPLPNIVYVPLFDMPDISSLSYEQLNYTRQNIMSMFNKFDEQLPITKEKIKEIFYRTENIIHLQKYSSELISCLPENLQQKIDDELYISKARNNNPSGKGIRLHLGITSCGNIFDLMEKAQITEGYNILAFKTLYEKLADPAQTTIFLYVQPF